MEEAPAPGRSGTKRKSTTEEEPLVRNLPTADTQQQAKKPRLGVDSEDTPPRRKAPVTPSGSSVKQTEQMMRVCG